jgi:hypothetical protein
MGTHSTPLTGVNGYEVAAAPASEPPEAAADVAAGAPLSNTAPANSTGPAVTILRTGIDSLYVSFHGKLIPQWDVRLKKLKEAARSEREAEHLEAQVPIGRHLFEVQDRGRGRFAYVLTDNWFSISLASASTSTLPVAHVQISSEALVLEGLPAVLDSLLPVVKSVATIESGPHVSRVDLCADFVTDYRMDQFERVNWITRARDLAKRFEGPEFSGWSIGLGGDVAARLYDKTLELSKSRKFHMYFVLNASGWDCRRQVWRMEFQIRRQALVEASIDTLDDLRIRLNPLWRYCSTEWLRLAIPNAGDLTASRWETHPLWSTLIGAQFGDDDGSSVHRSRKERIPSNERLFVHGLGGITSFMAARGITDLGEGFGEYFAQAKAFHDSRGKPLTAYVDQKVAQKGRRFNTLVTHTENGAGSGSTSTEAGSARDAEDGNRP